jgi:hypothetical protein
LVQLRFDFYMIEAKPDHLVGERGADFGGLQTKLNITDRDDPLKSNQGNVATGLKRTSGVASVPLSTSPSTTGEHVQGWILVPPAPATSEQAERKRLLRQIARATNKQPASQAREWLEQCWAIRPSG